MKNQHVAILAAEIGDLLRVNQFLNFSDIADLDQIKLVAKNYLLIYEILDFWGFIPEREKNTSTPNNYLKMTLKQSAKYLPNNSIRKERFTAIKQALIPFFSKQN